MFLYSFKWGETLIKIKPITFSFIVSFGISFIFLLITFWIFYKYSWSVEAAKDALSTTGSYFGAIATLGAACIAAYLFNDWRAEKNFDLENHYLTNIILGLRDIHAELNEMQSCSLKIKETSYNIISHSSYLNRPRLDINVAINKLDADIFIYSQLLGKDDQLSLGNINEYCKTFDSHYNQLVHNYYGTYISKLYEYFEINKKIAIDLKDKSSFERMYLSDEKKHLHKEIVAIVVFFKLSKECKVDGGVININFIELAEKTIKALNELQDKCIERVRPKK